jgi:hypothetical protein
VNSLPEVLSHNWPMLMRVTIPSNATPGNYTVSIISCTTATNPCTGVSETLSFGVTVNALTFLSDAAGPTSFPAIQGLATWQGQMTNTTNGMGHWCDHTTGAMTHVNADTNPPGSVQNITLNIDKDLGNYDGGLVYWNIAKYTRDASWEQCTANIQRQMGAGNVDVPTGSQNGWMVPLNGALFGYYTFPVGFEKTLPQDIRYAGMLQYLAGSMGSPGSFNGHGTHTAGMPFVGNCSPWTDVIRENSYGFDTMLAMDRLGIAPVDPPGTLFFNKWSTRRQTCADVIIGILDAVTNGDFHYGNFQYFQIGLASMALIHWWQDHGHDPRVPIVIKPWLDQYWSNYNQSLHKGMWTADTGIHCSLTTLWYFPVLLPGHCQDNTNLNITTLHNLVSAVFAWYWRVSGDSAYQTEGDEIFAHEYDYTPDVDGQPRSTNQSFRYSFDYVGWRQGWLSPEKSIE